MNKKQILFTFVMLIGLLTTVIQPAHAQVEPGQIVWINTPISAELRAALDAWLLSPPSSATYYAVTYSQETNNGHYVSLAGLNIENPDDQWSMTGDETSGSNVVWWNTLLVASDGTITMPFLEQQARSFVKVSAPALLPDRGAGGGSYVRFPWQPSKAVQYGIMGVYVAEFTLEGGPKGSAVNFVSGSDMGSAAANDNVYASVGGEITALCEDEGLMTIRVSGGGDSFLYGNLEQNENIQLGESFAAGQVIGRLRHGYFLEQCGAAIQQDNKWNLFWGFLMNDSKFQAEGCFLKRSIQGGMIGGYWNDPLASWNCGNNQVKPLGFLYHYGNIGINPDPGTVGSHYGAGGNGGGPSFWAYFLEGTKGLFDALFLKSLPDHDTQLNQMFNGVLTSVKIVFRIAYMLMRGNLNVLPALAFIGIGIAFVLAMRAVWLVLFILRFIKNLPGVI